MTPQLWQVVTAILVLAVVVLYLSRRAGRLDRLHHRVEVSRESLNTQLARRVSAARAVAASGALDPVSSIVVADAAEGAAESADADPLTRSLAESEFSRVLRAAFAEPEAIALLREAPGGPALLADLDGACSRVNLARRFHNDAVGQTRLMRSRRVVRLFRLAGSAPMPMTFEMDDVPPAGLAG